jgi:hypothetical protein
VYSDTPAHARAAWKSIRAVGYPHVYYVAGGAGEWLDQVMNPALPQGAAADVRAAFEKTREISLYFGGMPRIGADSAGQSSAGQATAARVRRRGC